MRIAFISDWFLPRLGGIELHMRDLARELRARGHEVVVHTTTRGPAEVDGIPVRRTPAWLVPAAGFAGSPNLIARVTSEIANGAYDLLHVHMSIVSPLGYAAIYAGRKLGLPVVVTYHSVLGLAQAALKPLALLMGWSSYPGLAISGVSSRVMSELQDALPGIRVRLLPNGIDPQFWRCPRDAPSDRIVVVSAMRLNRRKRPRALIDALRSAQRIVAPRRLMLRIAGDGPERNTLQAYLSENGVNDIVLLGLQSREELRELYSKAHIFVSPTIREAFGIAVLEARFAGLPVIAMRSAGCADFLSEAENPQILAADDADLGFQIARLASDDDRREQLGQFDPKLMRYAWSSIVDMHLAVYDETAAALRAANSRPSSSIRRNVAP